MKTHTALRNTLTTRLTGLKLIFREMIRNMTERKELKEEVNRTAVSERLFLTTSMHTGLNR